MCFYEVLLVKNSSKECSSCVYFLKTPNTPQAEIVGICNALHAPGLGAARHCPDYNLDGLRLDRASLRSKFAKFQYGFILAGGLFFASWVFAEEMAWWLLVLGLLNWLAAGWLEVLWRTLFDSFLS